MKNWSKVGLGLVVAATFGVASAMAADVTVGQFLIQVAKVKNITAIDAASAERGLRDAGMNLPVIDAGKRLTEGDVAAIASAAGVPVTTSQPDSPFSQDQVDNFFGAFSTTLSAKPGTGGSQQEKGGPPHDDPQPGKGKSKGFNKTPSEPV